jgi:hypothetical protein
MGSQLTDCTANAALTPLLASDGDAELHLGLGACGADAAAELGDLLGLIGRV